MFDKRKDMIRALLYRKTALTTWCRMQRRDWELTLEAVATVLMKAGGWERPLGPISGETW